MLSLQHPYISVALRNGNSYGGGQQFSENPMIRRCGCGIIAATDLLLYLSRWHLPDRPDCFDSLLEDTPVPLPIYNDCILRMNRRFFPLIPYAGINGLMLMAGTERFFRVYRLPCSARWCFAQSKLWDRIEIMLTQDIPVIMSVGPNFPFFWENQRARFYRMNKDGGYFPTSGAKAHYFTVTGMDESWLRISSWGRLYYLNRGEFLEYVQKYSIGFTSNILSVKRK